MWDVKRQRKKKKRKRLPLIYSLQGKKGKSGYFDLDVEYSRTWSVFVGDGSWFQRRCRESVG